MSLEVLDRHSEALFEFLWCPVCGQEVFTRIPFERVFCKNCNTQVVLRESLRDLGIRPLIKHRIFAPYDHAHNARIDQERYNQRSITETVNSAVKRSLGFAMRARSWFREFREIALMCAVYNIKRFVKH